MTDSGHWPTMSLGELVDLRLSSVDKKSKPDETPVLLCNYTDVYRNRIIHSDLDFMEATATDREIEKCALQPGDVVITKDSEQYDDIGVPALVRDDAPDLVCGYHLAILRPRTDLIDGAYLFNALTTREVQHQFHAFANGVTRFGLRKADIERVQISVPPMGEQRRIAGVLGCLDDKIELNRRMAATLEEMARALFRSWFVDFEPVRAKQEGRWRSGESLPGLPAQLYEAFPDRLEPSALGPIPAGWRVAALGDVIEVNPRRPLKKGAVAPHLAMADMPTHGHVPHAVTERPFGSGTRFINGDTLVARITPCLENGKTAYVDFLEDGQVGWGSTEYIVLRPKPPLPPEFAYCLARSEPFREFAIQSMTGTSGRQRVPPAAVASYVVPQPPAPIAQAFGDVVRATTGRIAALVRESHCVESQRDVLLPALMSAGNGQTGRLTNVRG